MPCNARGFASSVTKESVQSLLAGSTKRQWKGSVVEYVTKSIAYPNS
jgi:hypothetical protein